MMLPVGAARCMKGDRVRMPTFCSVCSLSQQAAIDRRLRAGESLAVLSAGYGVPVRELRHHRDEHVLHRPRRLRVR
jgi:hypothetical protein